MKCLCGHECNIQRWEEGYEKENDFIQLSLSNAIHLAVPSENPFGNDKRVALYACPKCFTVRTNEIY